MMEVDGMVDAAASVPPSPLHSMLPVLDSVAVAVWVV